MGNLPSEWAASSTRSTPPRICELRPEGLHSGRFTVIVDTHNSAKYRIFSVEIPEKHIESCMQEPQKALPFLMSTVRDILEHEQVPQNFEATCHQLVALNSSLPERYQVSEIRSSYADLPQEVQFRLTNAQAIWDLFSEEYPVLESLSYQDMLEFAFGSSSDADASETSSRECVCATVSA